MKKRLTVLFLVFLNTLAFSQDTPPEYDVYIQKADSVFEKINNHRFFFPLTKI